MKESMKKYYQNNKQKFRDYYDKLKVNPEFIKKNKEIQRQYYLKNKERFKESAKKYYHNNKEKMHLYYLNRKAMKQSV